MAKSKVAKTAPKAPAKPQSDVEGLTFPRMLYRADGTSEIFSSLEIFRKHDDGGYAGNPSAFGIETAPAQKVF